MKKISIVLCFTMCLYLLCGCVIGDNIKETSVETEKISLPIPQPLDFTYSSGAGGWYTVLTLKPDGTFNGSFHDSEMGSIGEGYPNGTVYTSEFSGTFTDINKIDDYSYSMILEKINIDKAESEEWIDDGILYISSLPYGLEGKKFTLYTPDTPIEKLSEEFLIWKQIPQEDTTKLSVYGLYNESNGAAFFAE